jgi:putative transposase
MSFMTIAKYKSNRNVVYSCKYHVVWCPKYRRSVLNDLVQKELKPLIVTLIRGERSRK